MPQPSLITRWSETLPILLKGTRRAIGLDLASIGEMQFCRNVLDLLLARFPHDLFYVFHHEDSIAEFPKQFPQFEGRLHHLPFRCVLERWFRRLDLYVTNEQFVPGPVGVYTLTLFHGQPSKGVTFNLPGLDPLVANDALFLYGPLQRQALDEHLALQKRTLPSHLSLFEIGYAKSDDLLNYRFDRERTLRELGLDPARKTILYAPAFNEGASLRECGLEILQTLGKLSQYNILAKLPIDCLRPTSDVTATGGVNWFDEIGALEKNYPNFKLFRAHSADEALACSDVLITCVSSIGFEFLALGRPVIFIETPRFYTLTLPNLAPGQDVSGWAERTTVNGGREFGVVVAEPRQLPDAIQEVLAHPDRYPPNKSEVLKFLLYNPGGASEAAANRIAELLAAGVRSRRPAKEVEALLRRMAGWPTLRQRLRHFLRRVRASLVYRIRRLLNRRGYDITRVGLDFLDAQQTVAAARQRGISVCDCVESTEDDPRKRGRRDRIIAELQAAGVLRQLDRACEIGAGTGRYLEKVIELARPTVCEVYETNRGWAKFLKDEYNGRNGCAVICHTANGHTLDRTAGGSCDLVHAHAVFVYLPLLQSLAYLNECVRVCRPGGHIVFDYLSAEDFELPVVDAWLAGPHRFPVVIPRVLLEQFAQRHRLRLVRSFPMIYGVSEVEYLVWQKAAAK